MGGEALFIPLGLLSKSSRLESMVTGNAPKQSISFPQTSLEVGHVMVHYLFVGTYQGLKPKGSTFSETQAAEFQTAIEVYHLARTTDLPPLLALAQDEIERYEEDLSISQVFDVVSRACSSVDADDGWFIAFLNRWLKLAIKEPDQLLASESLQPKSNAFSLSEVLLRGLLETTAERLAKQKLRGASATDTGAALTGDDSDEVNGNVTPQALIHNEVPAEAIEEPEDTVHSDDLLLNVSAGNRREPIWRGDEMPTTEPPPEPDWGQDMEVAVGEAELATTPIAAEAHEEAAVLAAVVEPEPLLFKKERMKAKKKKKSSLSKTEAVN